MNGRESARKIFNMKRKRRHGYDSDSASDSNDNGNDIDVHSANMSTNGNKKRTLVLREKASAENGSTELVSNNVEVEIEESSMDVEGGIGTTVAESVIACNEMGLLTQDEKESSCSSESDDEGQNPGGVSSALSSSVSRRSEINSNGDISGTPSKLQKINSTRDTTPKRSGTRVLQLSESDGESEHRENLAASLQHEGESGIEQNVHKNSLLGPSISGASSYMERIKINRQRNKDRLVELGLVPKSMTDNVDEDNDLGQNIEVGHSGEETKPLHSGMLFATKYNGLQTVSDQVSHVNAKSRETKIKSISVEKQYPHRANQIRFLKSCFKSTVRQAQYSNEYRDYHDDCNVYIPPPILVSGTRGTGKTAIVRSILGEVKRNTEMKQTNATKIHGGENRNKSTMGVAYIDCATCESRGIGAGTLFEAAYDQLAQQFGQYTLLQNDRMQLEEKKKSTEKNIGLKSILSPKNETNHDSGIHFDLKSIDKIDDFSVDSSLGTNSFDTKSEDGNDDCTIEDGNEDEEDWIENRRKKYVSSSGNSVSSIASHSKKSYDSRRRSSRVGNNTQHTQSHRTMSKHQTSKKVSLSKMVGSPKIGMIETPVAFGRCISQFCGDSVLTSGPNGCAFFILDNAEKLLSFTSDKQKSKTQLRTNWLSQILLLPKVMKLNLTIIVISNKSMIENTRMSNTDHPANKYALIDDGINPLRCHFDAYKGKMVYRDILFTPHMQTLITGDVISDDEDNHIYTVEDESSSNLSPSDMSKLYGTLVDIVIQSVENATRNVREIARLARLLWPIYISILGRHKKLVQECLEGESGQQHRLNGSTIISPVLLQKMGEELRPHVKRMVSRCLMRAGGTLKAPNDAITFCHSLPYLTKFLLLAGYLCQHNKASEDRTLFTNKAKGKKRSKGKMKESHSESLTHASSKEVQNYLKSERVYSFPLERMLSVFSSICNKYIHGGVSVNESFVKEGNDVDIGRIGSNSLLMSLSQLQNLGLIKQAASSGWTDTTTMYSKSFTSAKYICELSSHEAKLIAATLQFPLSRYLAANK